MDLLLLLFSFLAEYSNMLLISALYSILFIGGWDSSGYFTNEFVLSFKLTILGLLFILIRVSLLRVS
jgi:NADH:ubiquinone oxidoreductase subunit H